MASIEAINAAIAEKAAGSWIATENPVWRRNPEIVHQGGDRRFGYSPKVVERHLKPASDISALLKPPPPPAHDWRGHAGVTAVKDQSPDCGACVAFALCAAMESDHLIRTRGVADLSEGHLFFCGGGDCVIGWDFPDALYFAQANGVALSANHAYDPAAAQCLPAPAALRLSSWIATDDIQERKRKIVEGPVIGGMAVFEDFLAYSSGVYRHVLGAEHGYHAVCIVGYDDADACWIVKNSWGAAFGEDGYFRIAYGECEIEAFPFYAIETATP
ncbi:MAG: C1 family peptidase [Actinomycetota bacterium]|nr:C1 family peptidase [Actinomycetota bacterium]